MGAAALFIGRSAAEGGTAAVNAGQSRALGAGKNALATAAAMAVLGGTYKLAGQLVPQAITSAAGRSVAQKAIAGGLNLGADALAHGATDDHLLPQTPRETAERVLPAIGAPFLQGRGAGEGRTAPPTAPELPRAPAASAEPVPAMAPRGTSGGEAGQAPSLAPPFGTGSQPLRLRPPFSGMQPVSQSAGLDEPNYVAPSEPVGGADAPRQSSNPPDPSAPPPPFSRPPVDASPEEPRSPDDTGVEGGRRTDLPDDDRRYLIRGSFGGDLYDRSKIPALRDELKKSNLALKENADAELGNVGAAAFDPQARSVLIKEHATTREVLHEMGHVATFQRAGGDPERYLAIPKAQREVEVWQYWREHPDDLQRLNPDEYLAELRNYKHWQSVLDAKKTNTNK